MNRFASLVAFSLFSLPLLASTGGCAAPASDDAEEEGVEQSEEALISCGAAKYNEALGYYKNAVAWSKDRERSGVCESEHGYQWGIADEASKAVMTCGAFRNTIKTSPWAAPIRRVLGDSLTLRSLTGELLVIKDSPWQNWAGVDQWFSTAEGLRFWARAEGAYGPAVRVHFQAGGKVKYEYLHHNDRTGDITLRAEQATYTITKTTERWKRTVTITRPRGRVEKFTLDVEDGWTYQSAPHFRLLPLGPTTSSPRLFSLVSECDA